MDRGVFWTSHPIVDDYPRSLLFPAVIIAVSTGVYFSFDSAGWALVSLLLLLFSLARFFLPTRYELTDDCAGIRFLHTSRNIRWAGVRRVDIHKHGIHLSPFEEPSRIDAFRGAFLRFHGNSKEVVNFVKNRVEPGCRIRPGRQVSGST